MFTSSRRRPASAGAWRGLTVGVLLAAVAWCPMPAARAGEVVCPVTADNSIASYPSETGENTGNKKQIKIKGRENQAIVKFDLSALPAGQLVAKAVLSVKLHAPQFRIRQIGYSTVPTDWVEGAGRSGNRAGSCHKWPGGAGKRWGGPGSCILDVIHGNGGNVTGWLLARKAGDRWELDLPPRAVEAMRVDQPGGLILMDESGWWGGSLANIYILSRESGSGPKLTVTCAGRDTTAPSAPQIAAAPADLDDGQMLVEITCGGNDGRDGTALGFDVRVLKGAKLTAANWAQAQPVPRWRTPRPKAAGAKLRLWLTGLDAGAEHSVGVVAYDAGGNRSPVAATPPTRAAGPTAPPRLPAAAVPVEKGSPRKIGKALSVWAADELTKVDPTSGKVLDGKGYTDRQARKGSGVWNGKDQAVVLTAARNEIVAFRLVLEAAGGVAGVTLKPAPLAGAGGAAIPAGRVNLRREWYHRAGGAWYANAIPNLAEKDAGRLDVPAKDQSISGQVLQTVLVEVAVPKDARPGEYRGRIAVAAGGEAGEVPVRLTVFDVTIPDELSFLIELNSYGQRSKERFHALHRLAHRFRLGYNTLSYSHSGNRSLPCIPKVVGSGASARVADWSAWDEWMGPLLDGSLFADLPRGATPIPHFYLPFFESYPTEIYDEYCGGKFHRDGHLAPGEKWNKDKWQFHMCANDVYVADGFSAKWKAAAAAVAGQYRRHFEQKGWTKTQFQIFANCKLYYKRGPKSRATALWTLDEPSFGRDFRALGFLYRTFQTPFAGSKLNVTTRGDVSRPQWQGDRLDGACDVSVVSSAIYSWQPLLQRRIIEHGSRYWFYGGSPSTNVDLAQLAAIYLKNWTMGCEGGLAYWTSFKGGSWDKPERFALILGRSHGYSSPAVPTDRIAAQRRAQQDIELLNLLARKKGWSRRRAARAVAAAVNLRSRTDARGADDPGRTSFAGIRAADLARIRLALLKALAK